MQFSADYLALGMHRADVLRAERELGLLRSAEERRSRGTGASPEPVLAHQRRRTHQHAPRFALR